MYIIIIHLRVIDHLLKISNRFKRKPLRRGQPLYKGQLARPQSVLCSEVLLYIRVPSSSIESTINVTWYALAGGEATINAEVKRVIETEESSGRRKRGHYGFQIGKHAAENGVAATILC